MSEKSEDLTGGVFDIRESLRVNSAKFEDAAPAVSHVHVTTVRLRNLRRDAFLYSVEMASLARGAMIQAADTRRS